MAVPTKSDAHQIVRANAWYSKMLKQGRKNELMRPADALGWEIAGQNLDYDLPMRDELDRRLPVNQPKKTIPTKGGK